MNPSAEYLQAVKATPSKPTTQHPIYIPSRGRADVATTPRLLSDHGLPFTLMVEPQDADSYLEHFGPDRVVAMGEDNQGIAYVRNACIRHAQESGHTYHWQVDDNIRSFGLRINNKNKASDPAEAFWLIEQVVSRYSNIGGAGMKHQAFAFAESMPVSLNRQVYTSMLLRTDTGFWFRDGMIEDTDFNLQMLFDGWVTLLFNRVIMNKATTMTMKGGNTEISYSGSGRIDRAEGLRDQWPGIFKLKDSPTGPRIAPSRIWSQFPQKPQEAV